MDKRFCRELSYMERSCLEDRNTVCTIAELEGHEFDCTLLKKALDRTVDLQPNLRIGPYLNEDPPMFKEVKNPYIDIIYKETDNIDDWKSYASIIINDRLPVEPEKTLFRFTIFKILNNPDKKFYFFLEMNHANSDGTSGMILLHNILSYYSNYLGGEECNFKQLEPLPSSDRFCFPNGLTTTDKSIIDEIQNKRKLDKSEKVTLLNPCEIRNQENLHYCILEDGNKENFLKIKNFCKENNITVGNMIFAAYYFATAKFGYEKLKQIDSNNFEVTVDVDVNLRDRTDIKLGYNHIALFISINEIKVKFTKQTKFLELCKIVKEKMAEFFKNKSFIYENKSNPGLKNKNLDCVINQQFIPGDLNISNIGAYPFNNVYKLSDGTIKLNGLKCIGSPWTPFFSNYVLLIHSVTFLNYSFVYSDERNTEFVKDYLKSIIYLIENCYQFESLTFDEYLR